MAESAIEKEIADIVNRKMMEHKLANIRAMGGAPTNVNSDDYKKAVSEINFLIKDGKPIPRNVILSSLELLSVLNAQHFTNQNEVVQCLSILVNLVNKKSLSVLTGDSSEWEETEEDGLSINSRNRKIIKLDDVPYFIEGKLFRDSDGKKELRGRKSWVQVEFPLDDSKLLSQVIDDELEGIADSPKG